MKSNSEETIEPSKDDANNTGLPEKLKSGIEHLSGYSFDNVKVHYNSDRPAQLNANAYAQGQDIHIAKGQEKHLPNEAWHVVQHKKGRIAPTLQTNQKTDTNNDAGLEKEADEMGANAMKINSKNVKQAYNIWADQYDTNLNKTRDLEALSLKTFLADSVFENCLEIGCGTGKNTEYLLTKAKQVTAVDFSDEMLSKAKQKINADHVQFVQADITKDWDFITGQYDLVTFSLVLEHIENLNEIFKKVASIISSNGFVYVGELHPFKQYSGSKARFETEAGLQIVTCYNHHISDFIIAATQNGFDILDVAEFFDDNDRNTIPRIITLLLRKRS
jgi:ubiquinone/menaquinone biosynthesis C-methylase UbiE